MNKLFVFNAVAAAGNIMIAPMGGFPSVHYGLALFSGLVALHASMDYAADKLVARAVAKAMLREANARVDSIVSQNASMSPHVAAFNSAMQQAVAQANANPGSIVSQNLVTPLPKEKPDPEGPGIPI